MAIITLQCNSLSQIHSSVFFRLKIVWQVEHAWEKYWHKFGWNPLRNKWVIWHKQVNAQKDRNFRGSCQLPQANEKSVRWKWKKKKNDRHLNIFDERREFIRHVWNTRGMDIKRFQVNESWYIEGTICLINEWIGAKGMVVWAWAYKRRHKTSNGWYLGLVAPIPPLLGCWFYVVRTCWVLDN